MTAHPDLEWWQHRCERLAHDLATVTAERDYWRQQALNLRDAADQTIDWVRNGGLI